MRIPQVRAALTLSVVWLAAPLLGCSGSSAPTDEPAKPLTTEDNTDSWSLPSGEIPGYFELEAERSESGSTGAARAIDNPMASVSSAEEEVPLPVIPCSDCDLWSDPETWGGAVPADGEAVTIPEGKRIVLDESTASLAGLTIDGQLLLARKHLSLTADWVLLRGSLIAGSEEHPYTHEMTFTLKGADPEESVMGMGTRGLMVMGGNLELYGAPPESSWVKLRDHASAGATHLTIDPGQGWDVGDQIAIAPTDFYGISETEVASITASGIDGVDIDFPLETPRWGRLQYVTEDGVSETDSGRVTPPASPTPTVLDERAEVANLTRNILIEGPDDEAWQADGFGAHVMIMSPESTVKLIGVEIHRGGQRGHLGRYPIHWHRNSYMESGAEAADVNGHVVRGSVVRESSQRCMVIHATNGVTLEDNVCYDIEGHGIFLEDAVERRNTIVGNAVLRVRNPENPMLVHEGNVFLGGSSGFWLTNPDNVVSNNVAADAEGVGFWLAYPKAPTGPSANVPLKPYLMSFGEFDDNVAHSNQRLGLNLDFVPVDDAGNVEPQSYQPTTGMLEDSHHDWERFSINGFTMYKHLSGGLWNRTIWPDFLEFVAADNVGFYFAGAGNDGFINRSLLVGHSLNSASDPDPNNPPVAFASYHSTFDMTENVVVNFPFVSGKPSGAFATNDYYIRGVDKGLIRSGDNLLIESASGFRSPQESPDFAFAGALWDPHGYFGTAGNYWTYDQPFLTAETTCTAVAPAGDNGMSCQGPYYGVSGFIVNGQNESYNARMTIDVTRQSASGSTLGTWRVENGVNAAKLGNMRHFAALKDGRYVLRFPDGAAPHDVALRIENARTASDSFLLGVHFSGQGAPDVYVTTHDDYLNPDVAGQPSSDTKDDYTAVGSLSTVAASDGGVYYQDTAQNIVWVKIRGGLRDALVTNTDPNSDEQIYEPMYLRVY